MLARAHPNAGGRAGRKIAQFFRRYHSAPCNIAGKDRCVVAYHRRAYSRVNAVAANQHIPGDMTAIGKLGVDGIGGLFVANNFRPQLNCIRSFCAQGVMQ